MSSNQIAGQGYNLFELMQNDALSVIALHSFTLGYHTIAKNRKSEMTFPRLEYIFFVLPIVYNYSAMLSFLNSNELYTALMKEHSILLGLQERAEKMSVQTFDALNLAFSKKILSINKENGLIILLRPYTAKKLVLAMSSNTSYDSVKQIQDSAYKLGCIFAKKHDNNIQNDLNIRF
ncbi:hypothetical protein BA768_18805 [Chryseobacterium sp. CBo1]|uniref:three component ABC system middle component n=1 Tax=unclassified Chryseobacterium TaxID=2593645 RepID=UPI000810742B|nr:MULTISPECIES: three component ABC system middle component [unclassified Chryseobacterium]OCK50769.1 hypothetical protein BA768_18805 [Chryseobacterium sp. CBo1]